MAALRPVSTPKRSVSFGPSDVNSISQDPETPSSSNPLPPSAQTTPPAALKPALKAGTDRRKLPPPEQYQHPDPLLRRLRLVDAHGEAVNLRQMFRDTKVVGFYFASQWAGQPLKEYHQAIANFSRRHPHEFKAIYVSVDVDEQWYKAGTANKPWISMVWNDGSSMPSERQDRTSSASPELEELPKLHNGEDFLLANETDIDESLSHTDRSGEAYLRPFSRVHLAAKLNIVAAPTLCIYHLESGKMLEWNVRMSRLTQSQGKADETWERWKRGERSASFGLQDALLSAPYTLAALALAVALWLAILFGGQEFNIVRNIFDIFAGSSPHNQAAFVPNP
ncbi:uncharacterized protein PFL1_03847 [Pseudozyma flocculosa PF-1]|uniref:Uncharacterized protein n=2 Tax=Pseudozyma flocculosa TaxID=84751 RepID=A0A5C3EYJ5_9BASI|nr:uncharacterized protein PFL1_03847 [Pseudozyma flocculosa PF-1]EPQ28543.1 hypothetical protein PFL1_03847 [Pseudozyma flocculosa PF-1]SPO36467.1 uncharacterized protein PSFLO_01938 [Pseudozyma flocculosa]